jgi:hypothetical protein
MFIVFCMALQLSIKEVLQTYGGMLSTSHISKRWLYGKALLVTRLRNGTNIFRLERQGCSRQHNISAK